MIQSVPDGLGVRIPGFHPGGPGSIPGLGAFLLLILFYDLRRNLTFCIECSGLLLTCRNILTLQRHQILLTTQVIAWSNRFKIAKKTLHNIDHWGRYYSHDYLASDSKHALNQMMMEYGKMSANMKGTVTLKIFKLKTDLNTDEYRQIFKNQRLCN